MLCKVTHCTGHISANARPHQLHWGDQDMGTAISCTKCGQAADLIQKVCTVSFLKASSLYAAVLCAAVLCAAVLCAAVLCAVILCAVGIHAAVLCAVVLCAIAFHSKTIYSDHNLYVLSVCKHGMGLHYGKSLVHVC